MFLIFGLNGYCYSVLLKNLAEYYPPWHCESLSPCICITIGAYEMSSLASITIVPCSLSYRTICTSYNVGD